MFYNKKFVAVIISLFLLFLISTPIAISMVATRYHVLSFSTPSITGEIKNDIAHIELKGTVRKRLFDMKKYDAENYLIGPSEGGEPTFSAVEGDSTSFKISRIAQEYTAYIDIDLIKEFGKDYDIEQVKQTIGYYAKTRLCFRATDSNKIPYDGFLTLYVLEYPDSIVWK